MTKIKICGIMRDEDCGYLNEFIPDYAGFIFAKSSRRYIAPQKALEFRGKLDRRIQTVGVFVDEDTDVICDIARSGAIDAVQLHGSETDGQVQRVKALTGMPVIKAYTIRTAADIENALASSADMLLLDNGCGTGESFDWDYLEDVDRLYMLAGGLTPENVEHAVRKYCPWCVDVSTGVETDGIKDCDKIRRFINAVRSQEQLYNV